MMPGPWSGADDSAAGAEDHPARADSVRRPGSRPLADFFTGPLAIVVGVVTVVGLCGGLVLCASGGGLVGLMFLPAAVVAVVLLVRGAVELLTSD